MNDIKFYTELIEEVNQTNNLFLKIITVSNDTVILKTDCELLLTDKFDYISLNGLVGRNSANGPLTIIPYENIVKITLCNVNEREMVIK